MKSKGFTLIELMVVVAIIALLTSVVSALIGEGRDKARVQSFRSEIDQMVKAIELYRSDTGRLPGQGTSATPNYTLDETGEVNNTNNFDLKGILSSSDTPYLQAIPKPPFDGNMALVINPNTLRCEGSVTAPEYLIWVEGSKNIPSFMDWPALIEGGSTNINRRCFSIK